MMTESKNDMQRWIYGFWCPGQDFQTAPPLSDRPSALVIFAIPSPLWYPLPWCPGQLPQSPTLRSITDDMWDFHKYDHNRRQHATVSLRRTCILECMGDNNV